MRQDIHPDTTVVAVRDHVAAEMSQELVVLDLQQGKYFGLNAVGARIWTLIQEPATPSTVVKRLLETYPDVSPTRCLEDVLELLGELDSLGLIERVHEQESASIEGFSAR